MTSSLASQLNSLKLQQKDEITLPSRTKISFLFDIKQAANLDDQTLYYLCLSGLKDLLSDLPTLHSKLQVFTTDLLSEKSLGFYRGTLTHDLVKEVDDKLALLIKTLCPYFLYPATHKILEYLVRIYEIHAYHKVTLVHAFLPYFETPFFMRMSQLLQLKGDDLLGFVDEHAFKGTAIAPATLVKALSRRHAALFTQYAEFCMGLASLMGNNATTHQQQSCLHWKFFSTMLSEVLSTSHASDQTLLFNLLPFISQASKSPLPDLKLGSFLAISQLACRRTLTPDYAQAFFKQVLLSVAHEDSEKMVERGLIVLGLIAQYQRLSQIGEKEYQMLLNIPRLPKTLTQVSSTHDLSPLVKLLMTTVLLNPHLDLDTLFTVCKGCLNLKSAFILCEGVVVAANANQTLEKRAYQILQKLKDHNDLDYNQTLMFLLKRSKSPQEKDQILHVISGGHQKSTNLIANFGDKEYSLLSALGSQVKLTKLNALTALQDQELVTKLTQNEKDLIKLSLGQLLLRVSEEEFTFKMALQTYQQLIKASQSTNDFDIIIQLMDLIHQNQSYSQAVTDKLVHIIHDFKLAGDEEREYLQLIIAVSFNQTIQHVPHDLQTSIKQGTKAQDTLKLISKDLNLSQKFFKNLLELEAIHQWIKQDLSADLLKLTIQTHKSQDQQLETFYINLLRVLKAKKTNSGLLHLIIDHLPKYTQNSKLPSKILAQALLEHQRKPSQQTQLLTEVLLKYFNNSLQELTEFYLKVAMSAKSEMKRLYALISLSHLSKHRQLTPQIMVATSLILLNSDSKVVRQQAFQMLENYNQLNDNSPLLEVFNTTEKPKSTKKVQDKKDFTPMKIKPIQKFMKDLIKMKDEIISDKSQLQTALNHSTSAQQVIENALRCLLDLPTNTIKTEFIKSIKLLNQYSVIFAMSLQEHLNKDYYQLKLKIDTLIDSDFTYLNQVALLLITICEKHSAESQETFISSLVFPYLSLLFTLAEKRGQSVLPLYLQQSLSQLFLQCLLKAPLVKSLTSQHKTEVLRYYVQSQSLVHSTVIRSQIKEAMVENGQDNISDKEINSIVKEAKDKLQKKEYGQLEIVLEMLTQIRIINEANILPSIVEIIQTLSNRHQENVYYLIELCVQLCIQIIQNKAKSNQTQVIDQVNEVLNGQSILLKTQIEKFLEIKQNDTKDPFKEFIMEVDHANQQPSQDEDIQEQLIGIFQVVSSVLNLMTQLEIQYQGSLNNSQKFLGDLSSLIQSMLNDKRSKSAKGTNLTLQLFRFYHHQVQRSCKSGIAKDLDLKNLQATYLDTLLLFEDFNLTFDDLYTYLSQILSITGHTHLILLLLLCITRTKVSVKENLQLECTELRLIHRLTLSNHSQILHLLEDQIMVLTNLPLSETSDAQVRQRLELLFPGDVQIAERQDVAQWCTQRYLGNSDKEIRKVKYLGLYILTTWLTTHGDLQRALAMVSQENPESASALFHRIYLCSSVLSESISYALQNKDFIDKKAKKSLKRLGTRVGEFQKAFNGLLSFQNQVNIVSKVLDYKDKQTTSLKTLTLQLLLNRTPQFASGLSKPQEIALLATFTPLLEQALSILSTFSQTQKFSQDKSGLVIALLALVQRVTSTQLSGELSDKILSLLLNFLGQAQNTTKLQHSQLLLTTMTFFEVHQLNYIEHLQAYFGHLMSGYERISANQNEANKTDFFTQSYTLTLLKATLSLVTFFSKFLSAKQYEEVIKVVITLDQGAEVKAILDVISKESTKSVGFKLIFQALLNAYQEIIIQQGIIQKSLSTGVEKVILRYFNDLLQEVIQRMKKEFCTENFKKIYLFFKSAFTLPLHYFKHNHVDLPQVREVEDSIAQAFQMFVVKLNEDQLRTILVKFTKWACKSDQNSPLGVNLHKSVVYYRTLNTILNSLREYFLPLLSIYFDKTLDLIITLGQSDEQVQDKKRKRIAISYDNESDEGHSNKELVMLVVDNIRLNFLYDSLSVIQNDSFEKLSEPLSKLLTLPLGTSYLPFVEHTLKPCVFEIVERINNDDMWKKLNYDILMHTRNTDPRIRLGSFKIIEHLFNRIGERFLILLNDTLPFLSEGMEDENPEVEMCAKAIVTRIEQITGDSINEYLK